VINGTLRVYTSAVPGGNRLGSGGAPGALITLR